MKEKPRNRIVIGLIILFVLFLLSTLIASVIGFFSDLSGQENSEEGNVAVIPIKGVIVADEQTPFLGGQGTVSSTKILKQLEEAAEDEEIQAIVLEINSPGGTAVASDEIAEAVEEVKINKTVVAWIRELGASGGYWIASATNHTIANRMSETGSIGVIGSYLEYPDLLTRFNVTYRRLVSGKYKDTGSPYRHLTLEEENLLQTKINAMHEIFVKAVAKNRKLDVNEIRKIASGLPYLGVEAKELGLIDELGGRKEVIQYLERTLNTTVKLKEYKEKKNIIELLRQLQSEGRAQLPISQLWMIDKTTPVMS